MKYSHQTQTAVDYKALVSKLREAEQSRDFSVTISAFAEIWSDFEATPDFSDFSPARQAELFRFAGHFLSTYGKVKNRVNYQERAKDLLTNAIEIYRGIGNYKGVADAQNVLAITYTRDGAIREAEAILEQTARDFLHDKLDLVYLQNRGSLMVAKAMLRKYSDILEIIEDIAVPMEFCEDKKACFVFHEEAGLVFKQIKLFNKAIYHLQRSGEYANEIKNHVFRSGSKNNLADAYRLMGDFELAHFYVDEAISIGKENDQTGWLAHFLDTKAMIYFDEGNLKLALKSIDEAISIFEKGEDPFALAESIWNKCKFLLHLHRKKEAIKLYGELAPFAAEKMGEFAVDIFAEEFAELIHVKKGGSFEEETKHFRRVEIITAIRNAKYEMKKAAESLQLTLEEFNTILDSEFPELYDEINIERFASLRDETAAVQSKKRNITELNFPNVESNLERGFSTFFLDKDVMRQSFAFSQDVVMAIEPIAEFMPNEYLLLYNNLSGDYSFGKFQYDELFDIHFLLKDDEPVPFSPEEVKLVGKAIGYLPFGDVESDRLEFQPLNF